MFEVSDKVVCIKRPRQKTSFRPTLVVGRVYVVREVVECEGDTPGLLLVGVTGRKLGGEEILHNSARYRLLTELQAQKGGA